MNTQYFHYRHSGDCGCQEMTIALDLPSKNDFIEFLDFNSSKDILLNMGVSFCHPDDKYNKKIGREVANQKKIPTLFNITQINFENTLTYITLDTVIEGSVIQNIRLRISDKSSKIYFISAI